MTCRSAPDAEQHHFIDDGGNVHEDNINRVAEAGITTGSRPGRFDPGQFVTRAQMASFLTRAADLPAAGEDFFADDNGSIHEDNINRVAEAGIASGDVRGRYNGDAVVNRAQMATFLGRALGLQPTSPPPPPLDPTPPPTPGTVTNFLGSDIRSAASSGFRGPDLVSINGQRFARSIYAAAESSTDSIEFDVGRDYSRLLTTIGAADDSSSSTEAVLYEVFADGQALFSRQLSFGQSEALDLNITNVLRLRFVVTRIQDAAGITYAAFGNPRVRAHAGTD